MWDNNSDDESDGEYLVWPRPLRISEHLTHVSLSSLWELWLNDNNQSTPSICALQNTALSHVSASWAHSLYELADIWVGVESSDEGKNVMECKDQGYNQSPN